MADQAAHLAKMGLAFKGVPIIDRFGNTHYVGNAGDFWLPPFPVPASMDYRDVVRRARDMEIRDDDVLMCSFPKTGTHWTRAIICMLMSGSAEHSTPIQGGQSGQLLEMSFGKKADEIPSPRLLNTHLPFRYIPRQALDKKIKIVLLDRNPKDTLVSFYHHLSKMKGQLGMTEGATFEQFFYFRMELGGHYGDLFDYMLEWQTGLEDNPGVEIYTHVFEDMKADPVGGVKKLNDYLGTKCSEETCAAIASACGFDALKAAKEGNEPAHVKALFKDNQPVFYRKGEVGDWKNHFTVAMNEMFEAEYNKRMKGYKRTYRFTL